MSIIFVKLTEKDMAVINSKQPRNLAMGPAVKQLRASAVIPDTIPQKVFVEKKPEYEYTDNEPARRAHMERLLDGYYGDANFLELFHCLPEIFAPIHEIASRVADAKWELKKAWSDEVDYKDDDFNRLFSTPNPMSNIQQTIYMTVAYYLLTGRSFWSINLPSTLDQNYKNILAWFALPAHQVWVNQKKNVDLYTCTKLDDIITNYQLRNGITGQQGRMFETRQVIPMVSFSLRQNYDYNKNNSPLLGADKAIKNLIPVYEARGTIFIKRGAMGFIVSRKTDDSGSVALTPGETDQLHKDYHSTYGITGDKTNIGITGQPIDFISIGMTIKELQPFDETAADAIAIASTLRVPRHLVPTKDMGTFSNVDISMKAFYDDVIIPLATMIAEALTAGMGFSKVRKYVSPNFDHVDILQANKKLKAEVDKITSETALLLYKEGVITKNERNGMIGVQTVADGNVYSTDANNDEPMANKMLVGTLTEMMATITDASIDPDIKKLVLISVYGMPEKIANKIYKLAVKAKEVEDQRKADAVAAGLDPETGLPLEPKIDNTKK